MVVVVVVVVAVVALLMAAVTMAAADRRQLVGLWFKISKGRLSTAKKKGEKGRYI
jgi:hypothetical protein